MKVDFEKIAQEHRVGYGTYITDWGQKLLVDRYDERLHFLLELLQNAEDALRRSEVAPRGDVKFTLAHKALTLTHYGRPFDDKDVKGVCGVAIGTKEKDSTTIGRFGIGFKAVYAFTSEPRIYSGDVAFTIDSFVIPREIETIALEDGQTAIVLPFRESEPDSYEQVLNGLQQLGARTLLFLDYVTQIDWSALDGQHGTYMRDPGVLEGPSAERIEILGTCKGKEDVTETWIRFRKPGARDDPSTSVGAAFRVEEDKHGIRQIAEVADAKLFVFFPTIRSTNVGFLLHGPYQTTPSRDNVSTDLPLNVELVRETAALLPGWLTELRDLGLWSMPALRVLPLDAAKFPATDFFYPIFEAAKQALLSLRLIPIEGGGHSSAANVKIARAQSLRQLLGPLELEALYGRPTSWASSGLTAEREEAVYAYLNRVVGIDILQPADFLRLVKLQFLQAQPDSWIEDLYVFLKGVPAALRLGGAVWPKPVLRLTDGRHGTPGTDMAYLPIPEQTAFPTIKPEVCQKADALAFLESLGIRRPDLVDDLTVNVLPKYKVAEVTVGRQEYSRDIERLVRGWKVDSNQQQARLRTALQAAKIVLATDCGSDISSYRLGSEVYIASQRMKELFKGVSSVFLVDDTASVLTGEATRDLLVGAGASRYLRAVTWRDEFSEEDKRAMREAVHQSEITRPIGLTDYTIQGLEEWQRHLATLPFEQASQRAEQLWQELCDMVEQRGVSSLLGKYEWFFSKQRSTTFPAKFIRVLNENVWVPSPQGRLCKPCDVQLEEIPGGWRPNLALQEHIKFRPASIAVLATELGFDLKVLQMLKEAGLTSADSLKDLFAKGGVSINSDLADDPAGHTSSSEDSDDLAHPNSSANGGDGGGGGAVGNGPGGWAGTGGLPAGAGPVEDGGASGTGRPGSGYGGGKGGGGHPSSNTPGKPAAPKPKFVSYVAVHHEDGSSDGGDGLTVDERLRLERLAIAKIRELETRLKPTPNNNPGFDLFEGPSMDRATRLVEVKAMSGALTLRSVALSATQFEMAIQFPNSYWLYIVEFSGIPAMQRIVRIRNPAGSAMYFAFDHGWAGVDVPLATILAEGATKPDAAAGAGGPGNATT